MNNEKKPAFAPDRHNILDLFHHLQKQNCSNSYISRNDVVELSEYLGMSIAEIDGVLSFYRLFSQQPRGKNIIRVCDSLSCRVNSSLALYNQIKSTLGIRQNETTPDGLFTLETVNCLGSCDTAPNMMINDRLYTCVAVDSVEKILEQYRQKEAVL